MTMPPLPRSFRGQLSLSFALLGATLSTLLVAVLGTMLVQSSRQEAGRALETVALNSARLLADGLALRLREVEGLAAAKALWDDGLVAPRVSQALARSQAVNPFSAWIGVTDAAGMVKSATNQQLVGQDVSARPWFQAGKAGPFLGDVHPAKMLAALMPPGSDGGPQRFVDFAAPIYRDGQLIGVLGIHGSWEWTRATIESLLPPADQRRGLEVLVFDRAGKVIYAPDSATTARLQTVGAPLLPAASATQPDEAVVAQWADQGDAVTASFVLPGQGGVKALGWTIVARQPVAPAYAAAKRAVIVALWLGAAASLCSAVLGWWLAARLTLPLRNMARDAQALDPAAAEPDWPLHRGSEEIEQLSTALAGMTRGLVQANAEMEQRVRERTTELERANTALAQLATHDPLTGLLNRRGLEERTAVAMASARRGHAPVSLLLLDADHFKKVNDVHGHNVGDLVLQAIATCLKQRVREVDVVARVGGEEFVVMLPDTSRSGASNVAQALIAAVRATPMPVAGKITMSCGVAEMNIATETVEDTLRRADAALYQAKHGGRDRYCVAEGFLTVVQGTGSLLV